MSSLKRSPALKRKPSLPSGWVVYPSKSYPDRVYYFNVLTGCSSWDEPTLKQYSGSDDEQLSDKPTDEISKSSTSSSGISSHKSHELMLTSTTDERLNSDVRVSKIHILHKSPEFIPMAAKEYDINSASGSGLAAKRLKKLQTKLVEERVRRENSEGPPEVRIPVRSTQFLKAKSQTRNNYCKAVTGQQKLKVVLTDPQLTSSRKDSGKCNAANRLKALQKKLVLEHTMGPKQLVIPKASSLPLENKTVCESHATGLLLKKKIPSSYINTSGSHIRYNERFPNQTTKQNLSEQSLNLTAEVTSDELMEWEPIEEEKILSHIQEVRSQIQMDGGINSEDLQKTVYERNSIFSEDGKPEWYIVLDTNVLISSLDYIQELRDTSFKDLGFPVLVIPWQVLQELDILKDQRGKVKNYSLSARARKAVSFLHSNFTSKHPRIRGQTALEAVPQEFKIEVPDDAILQCCLHIAWRTNQVILLSNDKNLCCKAIVNGIKAYQKTEIQLALEELSSESVDQGNIQPSSGNGLSMSNADKPAVMDAILSDKGASRADTKLCKLKSILRQLLSRVLENEMFKVYDSSWKTIVIIKPPWTLSDILICLLKHWIAVFKFVLPAEIKPVLESLNGFFGSATQNKGYGHSLLHTKTILQISLQLCKGIQSDEYDDMVSRCVSSIERLQEHCEEAPTVLTEEEIKIKSLDKNEAHNEDMGAVTDLLKNCWDLVHFFCAVMCDVLGLEHHMVYTRPEPFPTVDAVRDKLQYMYPRVHKLIRNIASIRELPMSGLTVDHEAIQNLYMTLTNFLQSQDIEEKVTPESILKFCTTESTRSILERAQAMFEEMEVFFDRGIGYFVQW